MPHPVQDQGNPHVGQTNPRAPTTGHGRVNLMTAEEAQESPDIVLGTLDVHSVPATVLFDSGASHSFIATRFVEKNVVPWYPMATPLLVHSPGAEMMTRLECREVPIVIEGLVFLANLVLLRSSELSVILGMD